MRASSSPSPFISSSTRSSDAAKTRNPRSTSRLWCALVSAPGPLDQRPLIRSPRPNVQRGRGRAGQALFCEHLRLDDVARGERVVRRGRRGRAAAARVERRSNIFFGDELGDENAPARPTRRTRRDRPVRNTTGGSPPGAPRHPRVARRRRRAIAPSRRIGRPFEPQSRRRRGATTFVQLRSRRNLRSTPRRSTRRRARVRPIVRAEHPRARVEALREEARPREARIGPPSRRASPPPRSAPRASTPPSEPTIRRPSVASNRSRFDRRRRSASARIVLTARVVVIAVSFLAAAGFAAPHIAVAVVARTAARNRSARDQPPGESSSSGRSSSPGESSSPGWSSSPGRSSSPRVGTRTEISARRSVSRASLGTVRSATRLSPRASRTRRPRVAAIPTADAAPPSSSPQSSAARRRPAAIIAIMAVAPSPVWWACARTARTRNDPTGCDTESICGRRVPNRSQQAFRAGVFGAGFGSAGFGSAGFGSAGFGSAGFGSAGSGRVRVRGVRVRGVRFAVGAPRVCRVRCR